MLRKKIIRLAAFSIPAFVFAWALINSCQHDTVGLDTVRTINFETEILPIFQANCTRTGCHGGTSQEGVKYNFSNYDGIREAVVPGKPEKSAAYTALISKWDNLMPPDVPLSKEQRSLIRIWILQGAKNTSDTSQKTVDTSHYVQRACFQRDILPVLISSCALSNCHDNITARGGYNFTSYTSVRNTVVPGNPSASRLYTSITRGGEEDIMPPAGYTQLTQAQKDSMYNWIHYGALNEQCFSSTCDTSNVTFSGTVWPIINTNCKGCHSASNPSGGYNLDNYTSISGYAKNGILMNSLTGNGVPKMPSGSSLIQCNIDQVSIWVKNGASSN
jgi:hypothetical protein